MSKLFQATYHVHPVVIGRASPQELSAINQDVDTAGCRDDLELWCLVAIRDPRRPQVQIHALGWRSALQNTWITSRLVAVDALKRAVATMSGHVYRLGEADAEELEPQLREHLRYALHQWKFESDQDVGLLPGRLGCSRGPAGDTEN